MAYFQKLDVDADGKLSKPEFIRTGKEADLIRREKSWAAMDKDADGFLTQEEFVDYVKPKKLKKAEGGP